MVIVGESFAEIMAGYADCTGHAPLLPEWSAGFWQCKLRYRTQEELLSVAREYHKRAVPLAVIVVDFFHWTRQGKWKWDPECWPDPHGMIRELKQMGVKLMHQKGFFEGMKAAGESEIISLCRFGWAGSQRFAAAIWSGDIPSSRESFNPQFRAGLNIMMSGIAWWTTDIGGFYGGNIENPDFRELLVRWFQYGAFCPLFRLHGVRELRAKHTVASGAANEIWSFGEQNFEFLRKFILLREWIKPYIVEQARLVSEKGLPMMRPLFFDYPAEEEFWKGKDEFLFGEDLIVAPVTAAGARSREVYLPDGAAWIDAWSGRKQESGIWFQADAPLEMIPVFGRQGASVRSAFKP